MNDFVQNEKKRKEQKSHTTRIIQIVKNMVARLGSNLDRYN